MDYNDVRVFNASASAWTELRAAGETPLARAFHGFAAAGGSLYLFGGHGPISEGCAEHEQGEAGRPGGYECSRAQG